MLISIYDITYLTNLIKINKKDVVPQEYEARLWNIPIINNLEYYLKLHPP